MSGSINIDDKLLRKAWFGADPEDGLAQTMPLSVLGENPTYDGEWIINHGSGGCPAFQTGFAIERAKGTPARNPSNRCSATLKVNTDSNIYILFLEPHKGCFEDYQGMDCKDGATHYARSRNNAAETATSIEPQDWTAEHKFAIKQEYDQSDVYFYVDDVEEAHHTTNISAAPFEIGCGEPNSQVRDCYLKYPPGIKAWT